MPCYIRFHATMGSQKVPGMVVLHSNGRTYGNAALIILKVGTLCEHTLAPSILPLLEATAECFF
jgi:predicted benzoate:H+ symporter BenE